MAKKTQTDYVQALNPQGYVNNREITNLPGHFLVKGSKNCLIVNKEKVSSRKGYSLVGAAKTKNKGHRGSYDWETSGDDAGGLTRSIRMNTDGEVEVYYNGSWLLLETVLAGSYTNFTTWWSTTELEDLLLFVIGTAVVHTWSGAIAEIASATSTTLTLASGTWGEKRFLTAGTRKVRINNTEYAYTGGEGTATLTGLSGLPALSAGQIVMQAVRIESPSGLSGFTTDLISMMNNYVFYASKTSRHFFVSKSTDFTVFTHSTPRVSTEGFEGDLDSTPTAFSPDEDLMWISARKDDWYKVGFNLSADNGNEAIVVTKLKTATGQGAQSQDVIINIKNSVAFLSFEPTIDTLGNVPLLPTNTSVPLSDDIRDDLLTYDLTAAHGLYYQNQIFVALPAEGIVIIYNTQYQHWQPPQILAVSRLALIDIDGDGIQRLCGHSSVANETYLLFDGYDDNGVAYPIVMAFGYDNFGTRFTQKTCDEFAAELYASENTVIKDTVNYDYKGANGMVEFEIDGSDTSIQFKPVQPVGLGKNKQGDEPLGSLVTAIDDLSKLRVVNMTPVKDFFERQRIFSSESLQARFSIIALGENVEISDNIPAFIKR